MKIVEPNPVTGKYEYDYPMASVTTDAVIFGFDERGLSILLVTRGEEPCKNKFAFPGGFLRVNTDQDTEACALRELKEETDLDVEFIEEFGVYSDKDRDERGRVVTVAYLGLVKRSKVKGGDDAKEAHWYLINNLPEADKWSFDHLKIYADGLRTLREKIHFQPVGFELLPEVFTMPQLQFLYESILDVKFDRRNFANKMLKLGILDVVEDGTVRKGPRNPIHYKFNKENYDLMKSKGFRLEF